MIYPTEMFPILKIIRLIIVYYCLFSNGPTTNAFNCHLPNGCRLERGYIEDNYEMNENGNRFNFFIICDIKNDKFVFEFKDPLTFIDGGKCIIEDNHKNKIIFRWTSNDLTILDTTFNFINMLRYISKIKFQTDVHFWSLKGFDLNFLGKKPINYRSHIAVIRLSNCRLDFYHETKKIS